MFYQIYNRSQAGRSGVDQRERALRHGPLDAVYPTTSWDLKHQGVQEGDSPSFLYLVSAVRGLNDPGEGPIKESWGGKFVQPDKPRNIGLMIPPERKPFSNGAPMCKGFCRTHELVRDQYFQMTDHELQLKAGGQKMSQSDI